MKVLVVEDDALVTDILKEYLDEAGYGYECAANGKDALRTLETSGKQFDVILLDRMMPEMDGMEFMRQIEKNTQLSHVPVIMQTAAGSVPEVIEGSRAGVYYYITKPYTEELLLSVIRSAHSGVKQAAAS